MKKTTICPECGGHFKLSKGVSELKSRYRNRDINQVPVLHCVVCAYEMPTKKAKEVFSMVEEWNFRMMKSHPLPPVDGESAYRHFPAQDHGSNLAKDMPRFPFQGVLKQLVSSVSKKLHHFDDKR